MMRAVTFPGLGLDILLDRVAFHIGPKPIYWYGIIIALGFLLAVMYCSHKSTQFGVQSETLIDLLFFAVPLAIVGARLYYIIFYLDLFLKEDGSLDFMQMIRIWDGGLAIYGGVIAGVVTALIFCKIKGVRFLPVADLLVFGLFIGQCIGRWGNFVNIEAYGGPTTLPWRMGVYEFVNGVWQYAEVHPTFLYESLWNLAGFALLAVVARKWRRFDGQIFLCYLGWYGLGRGFIEGLRTDSLYLFSTSIRVSQVLGFASAIIAILLLVYHCVIHKHHPDQLWVNQLAAKEARRAQQVQEEAQVEQADLFKEDDEHGSDSN